MQDNIGELNPDRQEELKRERRNDEEEEEKRRKSALLFGSEDTFDSIASQEEKVCVVYCETFCFFTVQVHTLWERIHQANKSCYFETC